MGSPYRSAYCAIQWSLLPVDWGLLGVVEEGLWPIWSLSYDWSVGWLELSWHLMVRERGRGLGKDEADARSIRKGRPQRWKALRCFW